jgi:hypothetical protein
MFFYGFNVVQFLMAVFRYVCWGLLAYYVVRVASVVFRGAKNGGARRDGMREAMALSYTVVAAIFIGWAPNAMPRFVGNILESVGGLRPLPPTWMQTMLVLSSALVCTAFICNFSRSLWMLKSLDHAVFEPVPQWEELSGQYAWKKAAEFITRTVAALLFILVEFRLEQVARTPQLFEIGDSVAENLARAGTLGLGLYCTLIVWWWVGRWIAGKEMPWKQLFYYIAGGINSAFVAKYAGTVTNSDDVFVLLLFILFVFLGALYMLGYICLDPVTWARNCMAARRNPPAAAEAA